MKGGIMAMIKLIATDLDGTLCNANHCLDQKMCIRDRFIGIQKPDNKTALRFGRLDSGYPPSSFFC